jgi:hypothetical protein
MEIFLRRRSAEKIGNGKRETASKKQNSYPKIAVF